MLDDRTSADAAASPAALHFEGFHLPGPNGPLSRNGRVVPLSKKPLAVLWRLASRPHEVVTRDELLAAVWPRVVVTDGAVAASLRDLRKALGDDARRPRFIATAHGIGYRFVASVSSGAPAAHVVPGDTAHPAHPWLVGREAELSELQSAARRASAGHRQVIFVTGDAGMGKTSLVDGFVAGLRSAGPGEPWSIAHGQCIEHYGEGEPYLPVLEAVTRWSRRPNAPLSLAVLRRYAPTWLSQLPGLAGEDADGWQPPAAGASSVQRMLREICDAIEAAAHRQPHLLVLEDLHWSDASTVDLLSMLAQRRDPARLLVVATCRPVELIVNAHPLKQVKHERVARGEAREIVLGRLGPADVRSYLAQRLPSDRVEPGLAETVYERSQGHPLFMVRFADDVQRSGGRAPLAEATLPWGVADLIEAQIARLPPASLAVLEAASVAGAEFAAASVAAALEAAPEGVETALELLGRTRQFIEPRGLVTWHDGTVGGHYAFGHALYREVLYRRLGAPRRVRFHALIGARLEAAYEAHAGEIAAELALHFECACEPGIAARHRGHAAEKAVRRYAFNEALGHASRGRELLARAGAVDSPLELTLLLAEGAALQTISGYASAQVEAIYSRALQLGIRVGDTRSIGPALSGLYNLYLTRADFARVGRVADQVIELIERRPDPVLEMLAHNVSGTAKLFADDVAGSLQHVDRTLGLYDPAMHHSLAALYGEDPALAAHHYAALARWITGQPALAAKHLALGYAIASQLRQPFGEAQMLWIEAVIRLDDDEFDRVNAVTSRLTALCSEHGFALWLAGGRILRGAALAGLGRFEEGRELTRSGLENWRALGTELILPHALSVAARVEALGGNVHDALRLLEEALSIAARTGERWYEPELHRRRGDLLRSQGATIRNAAALAASCFERAIASARRQGANLFEARAIASGGLTPPRPPHRSAAEAPGRAQFSS